MDSSPWSFGAWLRIKIISLFFTLQVPASFQRVMFQSWYLCWYWWLQSLYPYLALRPIWYFAQPQILLSSCHLSPNSVSKSLNKHCLGAKSACPHIGKYYVCFEKYQSTHRHDWRLLLMGIRLLFELSCSYFSTSIKNFVFICGEFDIIGTFSWLMIVFLF